MADGDVACRRRQFGQEITNRLVVAELAVLCEQHDGHRGELLGDRGEAIVGLGCRADAPLEVGHPIGAACDDVAVPNDDDTRAGSRAGVGSKEIVNRRHAPSARASGDERQHYDFVAAYQAFHVSGACPMVSCCW